MFKPHGTISAVSSYRGRALFWGFGDIDTVIPRFSLFVSAIHLSRIESHVIEYCLQNLGMKKNILNNCLKSQRKFQPTDGINTSIIYSFLFLFII